MAARRGHRGRWGRVPGSQKPVGVKPLFSPPQASDKIPEVKQKTDLYASGKLLRFSVRMHHKSFGDRASPGPAGVEFKVLPGPGPPSWIY